MGYAIELSFDVLNPGDRITTLTARKQIAKNYMCDTQYFIHELEGTGRKITQRNSIQIVEFDEEKLSFLIDYICFIRKENVATVECVYNSMTTCDLLYASPIYINKLNKADAVSLRKRFKTESKTKIQQQIYKALGK
tara:strand:+ start:212 stop:622 length:411 start_codon:yes stop_codon:yes gene_type:complete